MRLSLRGGALLLAVIVLCGTPATLGFLVQHQFLNRPLPSCSSPLEDSTSSTSMAVHRKVCLLVEPTPFTHVSGYANRFKEMLRYMRQAGDQVDILTVDSKTPAAQLPTSYQGYPIQHTQGFTFPLYNHISLTIDLPEMKGAKLMETQRPDVMHVTSPGFLVFAALFYARTLKIPLVMSYHTHLPTYGKNYLKFIPQIEHICWDLLRFVHSRADLTLVTSPQMQHELQTNGIPNVHVWRKGIDTIRFHPQFATPTMRHRMTDGHVDDFLMVYVGRLGAEKRLKDIKPMLEQLPRGTRLAIVGKGPQEEELREHFRGTQTVFMGQLSGDELSAAFASADVFCMPSDSETLGFVVLESMASGVPVVGAAAGGILDLIDHGVTGYLAPPGDTEAFCTHLQSLRDKKLRTKLSKAARLEAEKWGWEAATQHLRTVQYEQAIRNYNQRNHTEGNFGMWRKLDWRLHVWMRSVVRRLKGPESIWNAAARRILRRRPRLWRRSV